MEPQQEELSTDEQLELLTRQMCSVRTKKSDEKEIEQTIPAKDATVVSKRDKSRAKDARRKAKQGR
jgi:hypothetical protein